MNVLDSSPIEALALNYVSFGFLTVVNNLWTWVAVITAAVSFWRIRATATPTTAFSVKAEPQQQRQKQPQGCVDRSSNQASTTSSSAHEPAANESELPAASVSAPLVTSPLECNFNGVTKGRKFTAYYEFDESEEENDDGELTAVKKWGYNCGGDGDGEWWRETSNLERVTRMRMGDLGWYKCQDLTAINGNVVRLWGD